MKDDETTRPADPADDIVKTTEREAATYARPRMYPGHATGTSAHDTLTCANSVTGHDTGGTQDGTCTWCGRQVDARPPVVRRGPTRGWTELDAAYRQHWDPDWGVDRRDW